MRLIDADQFDQDDGQYLRARLEFPDGIKTNGWWAVLTSVQIKDAPTIDAAPVIHASWVHQNPFVDTVERSNCGFNLPSIELATPYCPCCPAKMDLGHPKEGEDVWPE